VNANKAFSEVIQSSLQGWVAQSWQWDVFPPFGSLVAITAENRTLFHQVSTGSTDAIHLPFPYKKTHEELRKDYPQIFEFLKTTFHCLVIGYSQIGKIHYLLAPEPSKIHAFVGHVSSDQARQFFSSSQYLHVLFGLANQVANMDELLLAVLNQLKCLGLLDEEKLTDFIASYSLLIGNDYRRLKIFLMRVESHIRI